MDSGIIARVRELKASLGDSFYHPGVLATLAPYNAAFGDRFDTLFSAAANEIKEFANRLEELGGSILSTVDGVEVTVEHVASLNEAGLETFIFDEVEENPTTRHVNLGTIFAQKNDIDFLVAVGGGSAMDCTKGINFLLTNGGTMADYRGYGKATEPMLPSISIPTTAGTGSESQSYALIADDETHMKIACGDRRAPALAKLRKPLSRQATG